MQIYIGSPTILPFFFRCKMEGIIICEHAYISLILFIDHQITRILYIKMLQIRLAWIDE